MKQMKNHNFYDNCMLCPRTCGAQRSKGKNGICGVTETLKVARAALHFWEEPCISGTKGSGAVFFSGCALHCVFCQNESIAQGTAGKEITPERLDILRRADFIVRDVIKQHGLYNDIWQSFAILPAAIRSVGVQGDERTYDYTVGIRAVTSSDGMTADYFRFPWEVLDEMSRRICNEVAGVNRVVYDITSKPPSTIEWE